MVWRFGHLTVINDMISIQKKFLFIHVPKTGGNSIQSILKEYSEDEIVVNDNQDGVERFGVVNRKYNVTKHATLTQYSEVLEKDLFQDLFKCAVIRNPWDRMISLYFSPHRGKINWDRDNFVNMIKQIKPLQYYIYDHSNSSSGWLEFIFSKKKKMDQPDQHIDYLLQFERLDDDFKKLCELLDIPFKELPVRNRSDHGHFMQYYDEKLKDIVGRKFKEEIDFFGYDFEN